MANPILLYHLWEKVHPSSSGSFKVLTVCPSLRKSASLVTKVALYSMARAAAKLST